MDSSLTDALRRILKSVILFSEHASGTKLRRYQQEVAIAIVDSIIHRRGLTFVVMFPRQSGKNETQAQIETYVLTLLQNTPAEIVKAQPTWKPQALNAMRRLERVLTRNMIARGRFTRESGYIFRVGQAREYFLSAAPGANVVGATASTWLQCDEAQDVAIEKWDKDFGPMAASTNATTTFWGTAWTSNTLLARELKSALAAQAEDGIRRVFQISADDVGAEVPAYAAYVTKQVAARGRNHPLIRTQYFSETIDAEGGMFPPSRLHALQGTHAPLDAPLPGETYAFLLDVAGEDEGATLDIAHLDNPRRDSTALTIVRVNLQASAEGTLPSYQVVNRYAWQGARQTDTYSTLLRLADEWQPAYLIVDATGTGAGLASFLARSLGEKVIKFLFNQASKSKLGWDFIGAIDAGRFADYLPTEPDSQVFTLQRLFTRQAAGCQYEVVPGPGKLLRWSVPDNARDTLTGELLHDDLLLSAALVAVLDSVEDWILDTGETTIIPGRDPLEMERVF